MIKSRIRTLLKKQLLKMKFLLLSVIEEAREAKNRTDQMDLADSLAMAGNDINLQGRIEITHPKMLIAGQNIHIGSEAYFDTKGGLIIGDNVHIDRRVTILTSSPNFHDGLPFDEKYNVSPVIIEKNAWIGMHTTIMPGVTISEGAIIRPGSVITENVTANSTVSKTPGSMNFTRSKDAYQHLVNTRKFNNPGGSSYDKYPLYENGHELEERLFFILSSGRSGSKTISDLLNQHSQVYCGHEISPILIKTSTDYAYGRYNEEYFLSLLDHIYGKSRRIPRDSFFGESNQKLVPLAPLLYKLFPKAKFIWLIRDGKDVVSSIFGREWYQLESEDSELYNPNLRTWDNYRIEGDRIGAVSSGDWSAMTAFEKNCWYWKYWNESIESFFKTLPEYQKLFLRLEEMDGQVDSLQKFLRLKPENIKVKKTNVAYYKLQQYNSWEKDQKEAFRRICGSSMIKWGYDKLDE
ncbi:MAG: sulfotransferase [bacterium]